MIFIGPLSYNLTPTAPMGGGSAHNFFPKRETNMEKLKDLCQMLF